MKIILTIPVLLVLAMLWSGSYQSVNALSPVADLSGTWSGTGQFKSDLYGVSCIDTVAVNAVIKQTDDRVSGTYSFVGTSSKDVNPDPEYGNRCALWEASGGTFSGSLDGSRISITLSDDGMTYTGTYTSRLIKISTSSSELSGTIQLTATSLSNPNFEQKPQTQPPQVQPQPPQVQPQPPEESPQPPSTPSNESQNPSVHPPTGPSTNYEQQSKAEEKQLDDALVQMQNEPSPEVWFERIYPENTKEISEIIIPTRLPDNFFRSNGCGSQNAGIDYVPDFDFSESCNQHDICYARGGTAEDRKVCDEEFYDSIKSNSALGKFGATIYYWAVRLGGTSSFNCEGESCR